MQELAITWPRVTRIWWLIVWRAAVGGGLIGAAVGFVIGFIQGVMGYSRAAVIISTGIAGWMVGVAWTLVVVRMALLKVYSDFRLALVPKSN
jgi:hypothetical protein